MKCSPEPVYAQRRPGSLVPVVGVTVARCGRSRPVAEGGGGNRLPGPGVRRVWTHAGSFRSPQCSCCWPLAPAARHRTVLTQRTGRAHLPPPRDHGSTSDPCRDRSCSPTARADTRVVFGPHAHPSPPARAGPERLGQPRPAGTQTKRTRRQGRWDHAPHRHGGAQDPRAADAEEMLRV